MTLNQLKVFAAVSRYLNFTRASEALHISEPSVFQQVKSLEESCGARLYRKVGRSIELTTEGRLFLADAKEILLKIDRLEHRFKPVSTHSGAGTLVVGGSQGPSVAVLPSVLAAFKESHPLVQVVLRTKRSRTIERLILNSEVEIGLVSNPSNSPLFHVVPYRREKLVIFLSARSPLAKKKELTIGEVAQGPLIVMKGTKTTQAILEQIEAEGFSLNILMECESAEAIKLAVMSGKGLGILFRDHLDAELKRGELKIVKVSGLKPIDSTSFIIYSKDKSLSQNALDFLELLLYPNHEIKPAASGE